MHKNNITPRSSERLMEIERSLKAHSLHHRAPMLSVTDGGKFLKITNNNGSFFKMPMPRGDSVLIEGLAARKFSEAARTEIISQHMKKQTHNPLSSGSEDSPEFVSLNHGRLLKVSFNEGKHSFVIAMPDGSSPLVEGLATRRWGTNR